MEILKRRIKFILIGIFMFSFFIYAQVSSWNFEKLNENNLIYDCLSKNVTGKLYGSQQVQTAKYGNYSMSFNGTNDYVEIQNFAQDFSNGLSISCWVYPNKLEGKQNYLIYKKDSFFLEASKEWINTPIFNVIIGGVNYRVFSDIPLEQESWNHIAASFSNDSRELKIYINNELRGKELIPSGIKGSVDQNTNPLLFGKWEWESYYAGLLDEVDFFNESITTDNVQNLFNKSDKQKTASWTFNTSDSEFLSNDLNSDYKIIGFGVTPEINTLLQNYSAKFENDAYLDVNIPDAVDFQDEFTLSCWINPVNTESTQNYILFNEGGFSLEVSKDWCDSVFFSVYVDGSLERICSPFKVNGNEWHHYAVSYSNKSCQLVLYIDGEKVASLNKQNFINKKITLSPNIYVGRNQYGNYFQGCIDELSFFNYELTYADIKSFYLGYLLKSDKEKPTTPKNIEVGYENDYIFLNWQESNDNIGIKHYEIFCNQKLIGFSKIGSFRDYNVTQNDVYTYKIRSVDLAGSYSDFTNNISILPNDIIDQKISSHPKMFFDFSQIDVLREKSNSSHNFIWSPIKKYVDELYYKFSNGEEPIEFEKYFSDSFGKMLEYPGMQKFYDAAGKSYSSAFVYLITGDNKYAELAKQYLLSYTTWPYWGDERQWGSRDLALSTMITSAAITFDWIYSYLSISERDSIKNRLIQETKKLYEASTIYNKETDALWQNWWYNAVGQNHWTYNNSALGISALVLGKETKNYDIWLEKAQTALSQDAELLEGISDGSWHEGIFYQNCKTSMVLPFYFNLKLLKNEDLTSGNYYKQYIKWMLYNYLPNSNMCVLPYSSFIPAWGGWNAGNGHSVLTYLAGQYNNSYAQWLSKQMMPVENRKVNNAFEYVYEYFYYNENVPETTPKNLNTDIKFEDLEGVIWRTGWKGNDLTFGFKTGAIGGKHLDSLVYNNIEPFKDIKLNVGHSHGDANSFYLYSGGTDLSSEMADKYAAPIDNPNNYSSAQQSEVHNTILVDGEGQYVNPWHSSFDKGNNLLNGKLEKVITTENYNYLCSEASNRYRKVKPKEELFKPGEYLLNQFKRHILFDKEGFIFMIDDIIGNGEHTYDWICHFGSETVDLPVQLPFDSDWITGHSDNGKNLSVKSLTPEAVSFTSGKHIHPYSVDLLNKKYVKISSSKKSEKFKFINVLVPKNGNLLNPEFSLLDFNSDLITIKGETQIDKIYLINISDYQNVNNSIYNLTGKIAIIKNENDKLNNIFIAEGNQLSKNSKLLFSSDDENITVEIKYETESILINSENITQFQIWAPNYSTSQIYLNDKQISVNKNGDYLIYNSTNLHKNKNSVTKSEIPSEFQLYQNYPNPFNPFTTINFDVPVERKITIKIYNVLGREIKTITNKKYKAGTYKLKWNSDNEAGIKVTSGIYFCKMICDNFVITKKMILMK